MGDVPVHVELPIADPVVPRPREDDVAARDVRGDCEVHRDGSSAGRAVADEGLDDLEGGATVLGDGELAGATLVDRATLKTGWKMSLHASGYASMATYVTLCDDPAAHVATDSFPVLSDR